MSKWDRDDWQPTWRDLSEVLLDLDAPLEDQTGHYTSVRHPNNRELVGFTWHPWDCSREDWQERLNAGPGTIQYDRFEWAREAGRKAAQRANEAVWKEFERLSSTNS